MLSRSLFHLQGEPGNCMRAGLAVSGAVSDDGAAYLWGFGTNNQLGKGDDDGDELIPHRLAETKRFSGRAVVQLEFGGQHTMLLVVPKQANGAAPAPAPEPMHADADPAAPQPAHAAAANGNGPDAPAEPAHAAAANGAGP